MPTRGALIRAAATVLAALASLGCALALRAAAGLSAQVPVLAVALCVTLRRIRHETVREHLAAAVELPVVALATGGVGWLILREPWLGQPLLVVGLSVGILARRYSPAVRQAGRLVALPFVALLVTPAPAVGPDAARAAGHQLGSIWWTPLVAVVALAWTSLAHLVVERLGYADPAPPAGGHRRASSGRPSRRRLDPPIRMALQMAVGLAAALAVGHLLFGAEWGFTVVSAFVVASGNRGRGDVVHKAGLRVLGGAVGTVVATLGGSLLPTGNRLTLVGVFVALFVGLALRERSYAWWAAAMTAVLALLHAYYGRGGAGALDERLVGVLLGSLLAVAAAWFVLPVRTVDVFRGAVARCLAALTDDLAPEGGPRAARLDAALPALDQLAPTLRAHHRASRRAEAAQRVAAVAALHAVQPLPADPADRHHWRAATVRVRRSMAGRDAPSPDELPAPLATVYRAVARVG